MLPRRSPGLLLAGAAALAPLAHGGEDEPASADAFFVQQVLPILESRCYECHGPELRRPKGRLRMDREGLLRGGAFGPAIVPGDVEASPLVEAIRYADEEFAMPPEEKLPAEEIALLEQWIAAGAVWPAVVDSEAERSEPEASGAGSDEPFSREDLRFFEDRVRPVLVESCFDCHGPDVEHPKGGLRMTGRAAFVRGGDSGPALVPGNADESLLVRAIRYTDSERKMPPPGKLAPETIETLERWVALGAPWPAGESDAAEIEHAGAAGLDVDAGRGRWAFRAVERPPIPVVEHAELVQHPIDTFVLEKLEAAGLEPNAPASPRERLRRLHFVLVGLPPTLEEVESFEGDPSPEAWRSRVDELLGRTAYGERWARHWLDVVRFGQTNGYERDEEKPYAWRYRDWVVDALNADQPYDDFLIHQLAGDELDEVTNASRIATGFYRVGSWDDEPNDDVQAEFDELDDNLRTITEGFLGVTLGCARCHDHKFDPFPQEDYYSMVAFLRSIDRYADPVFRLDSPTLTALDCTDESVQRWEKAAAQREVALRKERRQVIARGRRELLEARIAELPAEVQAAFRTPPTERSAAQQALLRSTRGLNPNEARVRETLTGTLRERDIELMRELEALETSFAGDLEWALTTRDVGREPVPTHVLRRGRASSPGHEVEPRFLRVLCSDDTASMPAPASSRGEQSTGNRRALADWIARADHPLTARVIVNRVWHHHFGRGLVATLNDFGSTGIPATHPELLDWLATEFVANGWSLKWLHREIVSSRAWNMSSRARNENAKARDAANDLLWRQNPRRLDAESLRDAVLFAAGALNDAPGGRGFFPELSREALAGMSRPGEGWGISTEEERAQRALYTYAKRGMPVPLLATFDAPSAALPVGVRPTTTSAPQALALLNSDFMNRQAARLARRVRSEAGEAPARQIERAIELVLARRAQDAERELLEGHMRAQAAAFAGSSTPLSFRPKVPRRLSRDFLKQLVGSDVLYGPRDGWRYLKGVWGEGYNKTLERDPAKSAAALLSEPRFARGRLEARIRFEADCEQASLVAGAHADGEVACGTELVFLPQDGRVELRDLAQAEEEPVLLAVADAALVPERWHEVSLELSAERVGLALDGELVLEARANVRPDGQLGVRVLGGTVALDRLMLETPGGRRAIAPDDSGSPAERALESVCLLLLNLNEFLYVD